MRLQPNRNYNSDDVVQTPPKLARQIVEHFKPRGRILEPCKGKGNFLRALRAFAGSTDHGRWILVERRRRRISRVDWCEIQQGRDFFDWDEPVDWIVTNPPWSQIRRFLQHAMRVANHVVFLMTINHVWTKARVRDIREAGFGLHEILLIDMPRTFPQSGFQLGVVHLRRRWDGATRITRLV